MGDTVKSNRETTRYVILALAAFTLIIAALVVTIEAGAATGYEISIYSAYPFYFWVFLISSLIIGLVILVLEAFSQKQSNWWLAGLAIVILSNATFYLLPLFRNYIFASLMDPVMHAGYIKDIMLTGHFGTRFTGGENYYPASHILASTVSLISGLDVEIVMKLIPPIFCAFYIIFMYLLAGELAESRRQQLLVTTLAAVPLFATTTDDSYPPSFVPRLLAFTLLPIMLYLLCRSRKAGFSHALMLVLFLVAAPFWHPTNGGLFLFGILLALAIALWVQKQFANAPNSSVSLQPSDSVNPAGIVAVTWLIWFSATRTFENYVRSFRDALLFETGMTNIEVYNSWLNRAGMTLSDTIITFLEKQGHQLPYLLMAGVVSLLVWSRIVLYRRRVSLNLAMFSFLFLAFALSILLESLGRFQVEPARFMLYAVSFATVIVGLGLPAFFQESRHKALVAATFIIVLMLTTIQGVLVSYPSPFTLGANGQVTAADTRGIIWLIGHQNNELLVEQVVMNSYYLASASQGARNVPKNFRFWTECEAPDHFGYDKNETFGASYEKDTYFLSHEMARVYYTERLQKYPKGWRWTPEDFARLGTDTTVSLMYNSGGFEVFYVKGTGK